MHSLLPDYLAKLRFDAQQLATLRALGEYQGKQQLGWLVLAMTDEAGARLRIGGNLLRWVRQQPHWHQCRQRPSA